MCTSVCHTLTYLISLILKYPYYASPILSCYTIHYFITSCHVQLHHYVCR